MKSIYKPLVSALLLAGLTLPAAQVFARCAEQKSVEYHYPAQAFDEFRLNALAGDLDITESSDDQIHVRGNICADDQKYLQQMGIDFNEQGAVLEATAIIPYKNPGWHADYAYIDLEVSVPAAIFMQVNDSSGDINIRGIRILSLSDSSGDIHLSDTSGELKLRDASGSITIINHKGNMTVQDSSDFIHIREVTGDVTIPSDSSGDIELYRVSGSVEIERDSSGDIDIEDVQGNVRIGADSSGDISISNIKKSVSIDADGAGDVMVSNVDGDFTLARKGSGDIRSRNITGKISVPR